MVPSSRLPVIALLALQAGSAADLAAAPERSVVIHDFTNGTDADWLGPIATYVLARNLDDLDGVTAAHGDGGAAADGAVVIRGETEPGTDTGPRGSEIVLRATVAAAPREPFTLVTHGPAYGVVALVAELSTEIARTLGVGVEAAALASFGRYMSEDPIALESFAGARTAPTDQARLDALVTATDSDPYFTDAHVEIARTLAAMGDERAAIERLERVVREHPELARAHSLHADLLLASGRPDEAEAAYRAAIAARPDDSHASAALAALLVQLGRATPIDDGQTGPTQPSSVATTRPAATPATHVTTAATAAAHAELTNAREAVAARADDAALGELLADAERSYSAADLAALYRTLATLYDQAGMRYSARRAKRQAEQSAALKAPAAADPVPPGSAPAATPSAAAAPEAAAPEAAVPEAAATAGPAATASATRPTAEPPPVPQPASSSDAHELALAHQTLTTTKRDITAAREHYNRASAALAGGDPKAMHLALVAVYRELGLPFAARGAQRNADRSPATTTAAVVPAPAERQPEPALAQHTPPAAPAAAPSPEPVTTATTTSGQTLRQRAQRELSWAQRMVNRASDDGRAAAEERLGVAAGALATGQPAKMYRTLAEVYRLLGLEYSEESALEAAAAIDSARADTPTTAATPAPATVASRTVAPATSPPPASAPAVALATPTQTPGVVAPATPTPPAPPVVALATPTQTQIAKFGDSPKAPVLDAGPPVPEPALGATSLARMTSSVSAIARTLADWHDAWEAGDLDRYLSHYATGFRSGGRDRAAFSAHKQKVFARPGAAEIELRDVVIRTTADGARLEFDQRYRSPHHQDDGRKTLVLERDGDQYLIVSEDWRARQASDTSAVDPGRLGEDVTTTLPEALAAVEAWRKDWQSLDLDAYMSHYGPSFRSGRRDRSAWRAHKANVFAAASGVRIGVDEPRIEIAGDRVTLRFEQSYSSDQLSDRGAKTLVLEKSGRTWRIVSEDWKRLSN